MDGWKKMLAVNRGVKGWFLLGKWSKTDGQNFDKANRETAV